MATTSGTTDAPARTPIERTEHPHVVKSADSMGGEPRVDGWRMPVRQLFAMYEAGDTVADIIDAFPFLTPAQVHDAISYAYDHPDEMAFHAERHKIRNVMRDQDLIYVNSFLIPRDRLRPEDIPPGARVYDWETLPKELEE